jgi:hypothetical protein
VGLHLIRNEEGELGFQGAGGRWHGPHARHRHHHPRVPALEPDLNYLEAVVRVYNRWGRRDNLYKARIKILVKAEGPALHRRGGGRVPAHPGLWTAHRTPSRRPSWTGFLHAFVPPALWNVRKQLPKSRM